LQNFISSSRSNLVIYSACLPTAFCSFSKRQGQCPTFFSHASAPDLHRLQTQPNFNVYASTSHRLRDRMLGGNPVHFVTIKPDHFFGVVEHDLGDKHHVRVSDLERTLVDAARQPDYCGGFIEAAKALFMAKGKAQAPRIADYATRLGIAATVRRALSARATKLNLEFVERCIDSKIVPSECFSFGFRPRPEFNERLAA
jgi:predicted transcriptional regulator of viral defense system